MTEAISSALNLMDAPVDHLLADLFELPGHRTVVYRIAHAQHQASDQAGVDLGLELGLAAQKSLERGVQAAGESIFKRGGRAHLDADAATLLVIELRDF